MSIPCITNHAFKKQAQVHLAEVLWVIASQVKGGVKITTDHEDDAVIHDLAIAVSQVWENYDYLHDKIYSNVCMYMRPTITSANFNMIAWDVMKKLKSVMMKYKTSFKRNYDHHLQNIDRELEQLEAWYLRVIKRSEEVSLAINPSRSRKLDEDTWGIIIHQVAITTPL